MSATHMIEIAVRWGEALLDVQHVRPRRALRPSEPLEAPVVIQRAGRLCCLAPEGARRSLVARGVYRSSAEVEVVRELDTLSGGALVLSESERARVEVGALTYELRRTAPVLGAPRAKKASRALPLALLGALALHAPLLIALASMPPRVAALSLDGERLPVALVASLRDLEPELAPLDDEVPDRSIARHPVEGREREPVILVRETDPTSWQPWPHRDLSSTICGCGLARARERFFASPPLTPTIRPGRAQVLGPLSLESVRRVVGQHLAEVRFCYEQGLQASPDLLQGQVTVQWIVGADGHVTSAAIGSSELRSDAPSGAVRRSTGHRGQGALAGREGRAAPPRAPASRVEQCMVSAVRRWTFPARESVSGVRYPFTLQAQ